MDICIHAMAMPSESLKDICSEIRRIYEELDRMTASFQEVTRLRCRPACGACCVNQEVEATVLEVLPLARDVFSSQKEEFLFSLIEEREKEGNRLCVLYQPDPAVPEDGMCSYYPARPLLCRLFGFAARKSKTGNLELSTCKLIREKDPLLAREAEKKLQDGLVVPVYQDSFMRIATLNTGRGFRRLPVNLALKEALQTLYWEKRYAPH